MNMQKLTVTIGVPAFNEGQNMRFLLRSLLKQTETNFIVQKIIIVSDASTDNTNEIISNTKDSRVQLIVNKVREGQINSQNKIFSLATVGKLSLNFTTSSSSINSPVESALKERTGTVILLLV